MSKFYDEDGIDGPFERGMKKPIPTGALLNAEHQRMRRVFAAMDLESLVMIAATAIVAAETFHGHFCRSCGRRFGDMHQSHCSFAEGSAPVESFDVQDIDELVRQKTVAIRGGAA